MVEGDKYSSSERDVETTQYINDGKESQIKYIIRNEKAPYDLS